MKSYQIHQIDIIKGLAICSVIILHTLPREILIESYAVFHIWQAVPVFFILLGLNAAMSFERKGFIKATEIYTKKYFMNYFRKIIFPILLVFLIALFLGSLDSNIYFGDRSWLGYLPFPGPGNYFISIILQFILLIPMIYQIYRINPKIMLLVCFSIDILFQLVAPYINIFNVDSYYYSASIFRYFSAIAMGVWISSDLSILSKRNLFLIVGFALSVFYLLAWNAVSYEVPYFLTIWGSQNVISFFVPLVFVLIGIRYLPKRANRFSGLFSHIGKYSFDIFLIQVLYFAALNNFDLNISLYAAIPNVYARSLINIVTCVLLGKIFNYIHTKVLPIQNEG